MSEKSTATPRLAPVRRADLGGADLALFDDIATTRGGMPTSFRVFMNSPQAADAISTFGKHVRWGSPLGSRVLEIVCLRVAAVRGDRFMWIHHAVLAREAGLSEGEIAALRDVTQVGNGLDELTRPLVAFIDAELTEQMTDEVFRSIVDALGRSATMELALAVAYYSMLHTVFATLRIDSDTDTRVPLDVERSAMEAKK